MNLLVVGVSYRTAPVTLLERLVVSAEQTPELLARLVGQEYVREAVVLSTCNRVEIYAGVSAFHGGLTNIGAVLAERTGCTAADLAPHMYVHYEAEAVRHTFRVATGMDSLVVGEPQILGQLRDAYNLATANDTTGTMLHELMQQALRVGKRAHSETGIDRAGQSVVSAALAVAAARFGGSVAGRSALVIGAGSMGGLALATLHRMGAGPLRVASRRVARARRLAGQYGGTAVALADAGPALAASDILVSATASPGHILGRADLAEAGPLVALDLAVPRDIDPAAADLPDVTVIDLESLADSLRGGAGAPTEVAAVEAIVDAEVAAYLAWVRSAQVAPTVAALRARADDVVSAELSRLGQRRPDLNEVQRAEIAQAMHRVVQRLLHQPTVRVRELAAGPGGDQYPALLRELFDLEVPRPQAAVNPRSPRPRAAADRRAAVAGDPVSLDPAVPEAADPAVPGSRTTVTKMIELGVPRSSMAGDTAGVEGT